MITGKRYRDNCEEKQAIFIQGFIQCKDILLSSSLCLRMWSKNPDSKSVKGDATLKPKLDNVFSRHHRLFTVLDL
ncbi:hypothetical protein R6Q59_024733 [Mikania micrantha]